MITVQKCKFSCTLDRQKFASKLFTFEKEQFALLSLGIVILVCAAIVRKIMSDNLGSMWGLSTVTYSKEPTLKTKLERPASHQKLQVK
jgi:hypothetical protein